jgi:hypothetical protein
MTIMFSTILSARFPPNPHSIDASNVRRII